MVPSSHSHLCTQAHRGRRFRQHAYGPMMRVAKLRPIFKAGQAGATRPGQGVAAKAVRCYRPCLWGMLGAHRGVELTANYARARPRSVLHPCEAATPAHHHPNTITRA